MHPNNRAVVAELAEAQGAKYACATRCGSIHLSRAQRPLNSPASSETEMKSTKDMTDHEWVQSREFLRDQAERRCAAPPDPKVARSARAARDRYQAQLTIGRERYL